jgi:hypothetical protein
MMLLCAAGCTSPLIGAFLPSRPGGMPTLTMAAYIAVASNGTLSASTVAGKAADAAGY